MLSRRRGYSIDVLDNIYRYVCEFFLQKFFKIMDFTDNFRHCSELLPHLKMGFIN